MKTKKTSKPIVFRRGKRIYLRPILKEDLDLIVVWINDENVHQFLKTDRPMSPQKEEAWFESLQKNNDSVSFAIVLTGTNTIIGIMSLDKINHKDGTATTGSFIGESKYWSKGYGTEAKMLVLEYAFNTLNLRKISSLVYDYNPRSKRCLEKCGYKVEGIKKEQVYRLGKFCDVILLAVFKEAWIPLWREYKKKFLS